MAKDIKLFKDGNEIVVNELQLDNFIKLGYKQEDNKSNKPKQGERTHIDRANTAARA